MHLWSSSLINFSYKSMDRSRSMGNCDLDWTDIDRRFCHLHVGLLVNNGLLRLLFMKNMSVFNFPLLMFVIRAIFLVKIKKYLEPCLLSLSLILCMESSSYPFNHRALWSNKRLLFLRTYRSCYSTDYVGKTIKSAIMDRISCIFYDCMDALHAYFY